MAKEPRGGATGLSAPFKPRIPELTRVQPGPGPATRFAHRRRWTLAAAGAAFVVVCATVALLWGGHGTLLVDYEPYDAQLFVDGHEVCGLAPCVVQGVPAGQRMVELRRDRYVSHSQTVEIARGHDLRLPRVKLLPLVSTIACVLGSDPADAEVKINGTVVKDLGRSGFYTGELAIGQVHQVEISKPGFDTWRKTFTPASTDKPPITDMAQLVRQQLVVRFTSTPSGAKVLIDGLARGSTPLTLEDLDPSAPHSIVLQKACHKDATHTLLAGNPGGEVDKKLEKKPTCP